MDCEQGHVRIQFASQPDYQAAQAAWQWVNQSPPRRIILTTGGNRCEIAPKYNDYTPSAKQDDSYAVTKVTFSPANHSAILIGNTASLGQLIDGHWRVQGNSAGIVRQQLTEKSLLDPSKSGDVSLGHSVKSPNLFNQQIKGPVNISLDAILSSQGGLHWEVDMPDSQASRTNFKMTTTDVSFTLTPQLSVFGSVQALPDANWDLPPILLDGVNAFDIKFGIYLILGAKASLDVNAEIDASIAIELALSDGTVTISLDDDTHSVTGFSPTFSVHSPEISGQAKVVGTVGPTFAIVVEVDVFGAGAEAGFQFQAPQAQMTLAAKADTTGVCGTDRHVGVEMDVAVGAELDAIWAFGVDLTDASTSSLKIYATSTPVFSTCTAFGGPATSNPALVSKGCDLLTGLGPLSPTGICTFSHSAATTSISPTTLSPPLISTKSGNLASICKSPTNALQKQLCQSSQTTLSPAISTTTNPGPGVWSKLCQAIEANKSTTGICPPHETASSTSLAGINPINGLPAPTVDPATL